jgi:hypothetical protein
VTEQRSGGVVDALATLKAQGEGERVGQVGPGSAGRELVGGVGHALTVSLEARTEQEQRDCAIRKIKHGAIALRARQIGHTLDVWNNCHSRTCQPAPIPCGLGWQSCESEKSTRLDRLFNDEEDKQK